MKDAILLTKRSRFNLPRVLLASTLTLSVMMTFSACSISRKVEYKTKAESTVTTSAKEKTSEQFECDTNSHQASYTAPGDETVIQTMIRVDSTFTYEGSKENAFANTICSYTANAKSNEFWKLSVNGKVATLGAGTLIPERGAKVTWEIDEY